MDEIKDNVIRLLAQQGRTQRDLCAQLGITVQNLQYYFGGNITLRNISRLAEALGVEPWQILKPHDEGEVIVPSSRPMPVHVSFKCPHCSRRLKVTVE